MYAVTIASTIRRRLRINDFCAGNSRKIKIVCSAVKPIIKNTVVVHSILLVNIFFPHNNGHFAVGSDNHNETSHPKSVLSLLLSRDKK